MNKIEELIQELCPEGVEFMPIKKLFIVTIGEFVHKSKHTENGKYPVYNGGVVPTGLYEEFNNTGPKIIISARGANAGYVNKIKTKYWAGNSCYSLAVINLSIINYVFGYYYLKANQSKLIEQQQKGSIPAVSKKQVEDFLIPIPPLPIQQEIVSILDKFTQLEEELNAELESRRTQYDFYLNQLMEFEGKDVEWKTLGEVCLKTENIKWKENENTDYFYIDLTSVSREDNKITDCQTINSNNAPSRAQQIVLEDDIIFGTTRPTLKRVSIIPEMYNKQICSTGFCVLRANQAKILSKYLYYVLKTSSYNSYVENNQEGASYPSISDKKIKQFKIPIPPLSEQERIVSILDKFDALVNDTTIGLQAEIDARRKQYEYYRNKLLTFAEYE